MKRTFVALIAIFALLSVGLFAQRGGGRGGSGGRSGGGGASSGEPRLLTAYESPEYGLKFAAPPDMSLFTREQPGRFFRQFTERQIVYMVDLMGTPAAISVKYLPKATDADVASYRNTVDANPPQAKLPDYKKVSVAAIKIGVGHDKDAVEYVYTAKDKDTLTTTRQVVFVHKGNGFIFTCAAPEKDYATMNRKSFDPLFAGIEFK